MDRIHTGILRGFVAVAVLFAATASHPAMAAPCNGYTRVVTFADGSSRLAQGTACLARDGQWRVADEHLTPQAVYSQPPRVAYAPAYYPAYPVYYDPWLWVWPAAFLSIGYSSGYNHHHHYGHHHW